MSAPTPPPSRLVVPNSTFRETLIAVVCGVLVLGFVVYGVMTMGAKQQPASVNTLSGKVVGKKFPLSRILARSTIDPCGGALPDPRHRGLFQEVRS